ncbi:hypothetical protein EWI17_07875, partial [Enterococcus faecium]
LSQNVVHSDSDLILHNSSVLIDKEPYFANPALFIQPIFLFEYIKRCGNIVMTNETTTIDNKRSR